MMPLLVGPCEAEHEDQADDKPSATRRQRLFVHAFPFGVTNPTDDSPSCVTVQEVRAGPGESFVRGRNARMEEWSVFTTTYVRGYWGSGTSGFLGLEFQIDGQAHYGWAEVFMTGGGPFEKYRGVVKGYAYNTVPNQPLLAGFLVGAESDGDQIGEMSPPTATLGLLALGAPGLDIWRRRERASS